MKTLIMLFSLSFLALPALGADCYWIGQDMVSIVWQEEDPEPVPCKWCIQTTEFNQIVTAWVVVLSPSRPIGGWEFCFVNSDGSPMSPPAWITYLSHTVRIIPNELDFPCERYTFDSFYPNPPGLLPIEEISFQVLAPGTPPWCFGIAPVGDPAVPGEISYIDGENADNRVILDAAYLAGETRYTMACINKPDCPDRAVETDAHSWGWIKSLYR